MNRAGETHFPSRQDAKRTHPRPKPKGDSTMTNKQLDNRVKKLQGIEAQICNIVVSIIIHGG